MAENMFLVTAWNSSIHLCSKERYEYDLVLKTVLKSRELVLVLKIDISFF